MREDGSFGKRSLIDGGAEQLRQLDGCVPAQGLVYLLAQNQDELLRLRNAARKGG
jgi:hypothetical protein